MKTSFFFCGLVGTLLIVAALGSAQPPQPDQVVILDNQKILLGEVLKDSEGYRIRRGTAETWIPKDRVRAVCSSLPEAYKHLRDALRGDDLRGHLQLAQWCDSQGLRAEAIQEVQHALVLQPNHTIARATLQRYQNKPVSQSPPAPAVLPEKVVDATQASEPIDCGSESFKRFALKVQPVLMNACVGCHSGENCGSFRLTRAYPGSTDLRVATQHNLAAALAQIDRAQPQASSLLQHAVTAHGTAKTPPLRDRGVPAFRQLHDWVHLAQADAMVHSVRPSQPSTTPKATPIVAASAVEKPAQSMREPASENAKTVAESGFAQGAEDRPAEVKPTDPFDPEAFNRKFHGEQKPPAANPPALGTATPPNPTKTTANPNR